MFRDSAVDIAPVCGHGWSGEEFIATTTNAVARLIDCLQSLGPVLCLYRHDPRCLPAQWTTAQPWPAHPELGALVTATRVQVQVEIDSWGVHEWLWFGQQQLNFGIALLPDSDYYAWSRLVDAISGPSVSAPPRSEPRCRQRAGYNWLAKIRRFEHLQLDGVGVCCFHRAARLSAIGRSVALREIGRRGSIMDPAEFA